jgi:hypothetical protein
MRALVRLTLGRIRLGARMFGEDWAWEMTRRARMDLDDHLTAREVRGLLNGPRPRPLGPWLATWAAYAGKTYAVCNLTKEEFGKALADDYEQGVPLPYRVHLERLKAAAVRGEAIWNPTGFVKRLTEEQKARLRAAKLGRLPAPPPGEDSSPQQPDRRQPVSKHYEFVRPNKAFTDLHKRLGHNLGVTQGLIFEAAPDDKRTLGRALGFLHEYIELRLNGFPATDVAMDRFVMLRLDEIINKLDPPT